MRYDLLITDISIESIKSTYQISYLEYADAISIKIKTNQPANPEYTLIGFLYPKHEIILINFMEVDIRFVDAVISSIFGYMNDTYRSYSLKDIERRSCGNSLYDMMFKYKKSKYEASAEYWENNNIGKINKNIEDNIGNMNEGLTTYGNKYEEIAKGRYA